MACSARNDDTPNHLGAALATMAVRVHLRAALATWTVYTTSEDSHGTSHRVTSRLRLSCASVCVLHRLYHWQSLSRRRRCWHSLGRSLLCEWKARFQDRALRSWRERHADLQFIHANRELATRQRLVVAFARFRCASMPSIRSSPTAPPHVIAISPYARSFHPPGTALF